ncbi:hypothetical protein EXIGLDRAFT_12985 [Exidia glandulosa HHB12029]|uniref:Uncharacterized protein n=1 Tax=Exidia glandulosa HHB12029 TaxID=1314781 RepID=A0A166BU41_EXIGL|nr:hypothetical protein EXIGLDRAFT_12985 [Exidia glandulosa HHB12029]
MNPAALAGAGHSEFTHGTAQAPGGPASFAAGQAQASRAAPAHNVHGTPARDRRESGVWTNPNAVKSTAQRQPFGAGKGIGISHPEASASTEEVEALLGVPMSRNQALPSRSFSFRSNPQSTPRVSGQNIIATPTSRRTTGGFRPARGFMPR